MWYETLIRNILWAFLFTGLWMIFHTHIISAVKEKIKDKSRLGVGEVETKKESQFIIMIQQFLGTAIGRDSKAAAYGFIALLVMVSIMSLTTLQASGRSGVEVILFTLASPAVIILYLIYRLRQLRVKTSHEGKHIINELLNNYRINHKNIGEAIDHTVYNLKNYPNAKALMVQLALGLKEYRNEEELRNVVNLINYRIDSKWAILLSNLIYAAAYDGDDITEGLIDLAKDLSELEQINEKNKQLNLEGTIMIQIFIPGIIVGGIYMILSYTDFTVAKYIEYQFVNDIGFTLFYYSVMAVAVTVLTFLFLRKEKNDF